MSHGNIRPAKALIFKGRAGSVYAKLAGFSYAGWATNNKNDTLMKPPQSWLWNRPEYHYRGFNVLGARKLDTYSFGTLCLWLLFFDRPSSSHSVPTVGYETQTWPLDGSNCWTAWKHKDTLRDFAGHLVKSDRNLPADQRETLERFFMAALARGSEQRALNFEYLISVMGQSWYVLLLAKFAVWGSHLKLGRQPGPSTMDADQMEIDHSNIKFEASVVKIRM